MSLQDGAISAYDLLDLLREAEPKPSRQRFTPIALDFRLSKVCAGWITNGCNALSSVRPTPYVSHVYLRSLRRRKEECAEGVEGIMHTLAAEMGFALRHNVIEAHGLCGMRGSGSVSCLNERQHDPLCELKKKPR